MEYVLNISCPDRPGLVSQISTWLFKSGCNIVDSDQFTDSDHGRFFIRIHFSGDATQQQLELASEDMVRDCAMSLKIWAVDARPKVLVMVSRQTHCLADLIYRTRNGELPIEIALIVSNHRDAYSLAASADIDFLHLPVSGTDKAVNDARLLREIGERNIDFVVLARYMQILGAEVCGQMAGRVINIHHSFLPSFKGAKPYHQAFAKGVKLIGATAHYVTEDLDEGPIIEQGVERVDHRMTSDQLVAVGRDIERIVLAKAVRYQAERRIILNEGRTIVFH